MRNRLIRLGGRQSAATALLLILAGTAAAPATAASTRQEQWFLDAMHAEEMWKTSTGKGVTVAVIDSGVNPANPDLAGRVLPGKDFADDQPGDEHADYNGHGTGMAGLIAATGAYGRGKGAYGLAPGARILPVRMPKAETAANQAAGDERFNNIAPQAIRYAVDAGARVINISLGHVEGSSRLTAAVKYALENGALVFAAVGNSGNTTNQVEYPAATPGVVGVAAVGKDLRRTAESEYGPQVDMAAPGDDLVYACGGKTGLCEGHGTSGATALASASAALIWSAHPDWTNNQVLRVMLNTLGAPTDGAKRNDSIGYGIVRPRIALTDPGDPGPADVYPLPDLKAAASVSPSPSAGDSAPARDADATAAVGTAEGSDTTLPWPAVLGIGAAGLLFGAATVLLVLARRRKAAASRDQAALSGHIPSAPTGFGPPPEQGSRSR
ncbi:type VII secretion-associated serine protease mycosin [Streptomyces galbus]|uniref:Type VII secretion-associated serine protease mycosin n=1 Tax=Streptomyces galbus TaxID=33898 RepID=A0A4V6AYE9_STRGB|nr:type VII secretion-associated serine protease mycosin [Streptomyces galbus]TKT10983.1 type VII secretion-associated serine protease mycosin [Streptomyces galbus]GHD45493.1 type VII secretion-associated serine protease [Streptomyces galbus]